MSLTKYTVTVSGSWVCMAPTEAGARKEFFWVEKRWGNAAQVEKWVYPILPDGTHGKPTKTLLPRA